MSKVFVLNELESRDYSTAIPYGELIFVTKGYVNLHDLGQLRRKLDSLIKFSNPSDYVIVIGPSVLIMLFGILWFQKHGLMNVLAWNSQVKGYVPFVIGLG